MKNVPESREHKPSGGYWSKRSNMMYYQYVDFLVRALAADARSLIDVGSADAQYIENFAWIPKRNTLDIRKPYTSENVAGIEMNFFDFEPEEKYDFATCLQVLEHIPDAKPFARKLFEVADRILISVHTIGRKAPTPAMYMTPLTLASYSTGPAGSRVTLSLSRNRFPDHPSATGSFVTIIPKTRS